MRRRAFWLLLATVALAGCGGSSHPAATRPRPKPLRTIWLCFPGRAADPCASSLATTYIGAHGHMRVERPRAPKSPPIDCFYVYPTISDENRGNADRSIGLRQILVAQTQASRFSEVCKVYAPVYRQITDRGLTTPSLHPRAALAYGDVLTAWRDYLAHWNKGRGVVLIGHSQGAYVLKHLIATTVDRSPAERRLLVSAILLGGQVHTGRHGDFRHVRPCARATATGCVIAYSTFDRVPPRNAVFGRSRIPGTSILCVNPARPGATGALPVTPMAPTLVAGFAGLGGATAVGTPWVAYPGLYTARCAQAGTATWLQVDRLPSGPSDRRPTIEPQPDASWGLHIADVNIALAQLVDVVRGEARAYATR
jgi:hypothetical protein